MTAAKSKQTESRRAAGAKAEETRARILEAALRVFRERGFEQATMREVASEAKVAVGAAYYYFDSKDALVMAFYQRSHVEMKAATEDKLQKCNTLESRLHAIIAEKFDYFLPNRKLMGALTAHIDPTHPLSPFSRETAAIRNDDIDLFEHAVVQSKVRLPATILPYLPRLLWMYQMGLILFWVYDSSPDQAKTKQLFEKTLKMLLLVLRIAGLPILRPLHKLAGDLLQVVYGKP